MYHPPSQRLLLEQLEHLRVLHRKKRAGTGRRLEEQQAREKFGKNLVGNIRQGNHRPLPRTIVEMARHFGLSLDGAHRFFGYRLERIQSFDFRWNGARTRFIESYPFHQRAIDLPLRLDEYALSRPAWMKEFVVSWQRGVSMRDVQRQEWYAHGVRYAQIGWEDSLSSPLPAGAIVSVLPITQEERQHPHPNSVYMLQFGNGYRCCRCSVNDGSLRLYPYRADSVFPLEFHIDTEVRIMGRIGGFALHLPQKKHGVRHDLLDTGKKAPLGDPVEHLSLDALFSAKHFRFHRSQHYWQTVVPHIEEELQIHMSERTIRRYFGRTRSLPRLDHLVGITLYFGCCYSDVWCVLRYLEGSEVRGYSLEDLLSVDDLDDLETLYPELETPYLEEQWLLLVSALGGWSPMFSIWFPEMAALQKRILRIQKCDEFHGISSLLSSGSYLLLHHKAGFAEEDLYSEDMGWERALYVLRRGQHVFCGYLLRDNGRYLLRTHSGIQWEFLPLAIRELGELLRVTGAAVPL